MFSGRPLFIGNGTELTNFGLGSGGQWDKLGRACFWLAHGLEQYANELKVTGPTVCGSANPAGFQTLAQRLGNVCH